MLETELKFKINDLRAFLLKLKGVKPRVFYIQDEVWGGKAKYKIRKRFIWENGKVKIKLIRTTPKKGKVKSIIEETISRTPKGFKKQNSYDKIRYEFQRYQCKITIDFYTIGVFCEIEGNEKQIISASKKLGFNLKDNLIKNIDAIYYEQTKKPKLNWGFGI